ncbi:MAG TPA: glycosyltransferase family 2 protein, partial [Planctomycetota bacterium]|nr:glycosyltransferase family 2 protein [Planctomycetota bacterium]
MPALSAAIISFNEEARIVECLESLRGVVDEIVLVDSNSTDRTRELAAPYVDVLIEQPFLGHVEQKNLAAQRASHDWVLSLDCDERLTPELAASILAAKQDLDQHAAWEFTRKTFYVYRWLEHLWYPEWRVRLFDRRRARWGGTNPHDKVVVSEGTVGRLRGDCLHRSFESVAGHVKTLQTFTDIAAAGMLARGQRVGVLDPLTHSVWTFVRLYVLQRGFLDGFAGLCASVL